MTTAGNPKPKKGLGRGLSALISSSAVPVTPDSPATRELKDPESSNASTDSRLKNPTATGGTSEGVTYLALSEISRNESQPRQHFEDEDIESLSRSIKEQGIIQPVLVRPLQKADTSYEIVAGERRWRAAEQAGLTQIPVIIKDITDRESLELAIVENVQRAALSPLEEATAYQRLIDEFSLNQKEVAQKIGKNRSSVANYIRLLKLPRKVQELLRQEKITFGHARAILTVKEPTAQVSLANKVVEEDLSVRELEKIVSRVVVLETPNRERPVNKKQQEAPQTSFPEVTDRIRQSLGTKVLIRHHESGRGKIEIDYFSEQELDRLVDKICLGGEKL